jgi:hypothetical protein
MRSAPISFAPLAAGLLACCLPTFLAAAPAAADVPPQPSWIDLQGEVADAPLSAITDAVFADGEVWAVGPVERADGPGFALARWSRDPATGRLRFARAYTREQLGQEGLARIHALAVSADGRFVYLGARTPAFESRIVVFERNPPDNELTLVQSLGGLPASANEGRLLLAPDGRHLYYGSRGIVICDRDAATGRLTRKAVAGFAAVIDLQFDQQRDQLYSSGEELLHVWRRDSTTGILSSIGVFDELDVRTPDGSLVRAGSGRRLLRSAGGEYLYVLAFGPALATDPWSLVVFEMGGVPLLIGWGQGGPTGSIFPSAVALEPGTGNLVVAKAAPAGGTAELVVYPKADGGRRFGNASQQVGFAGRGDRENVIDVLHFSFPAELYTGIWDGALWQRFSLAAGRLEPSATFDGVERFQRPVDLALSPDRQNLLVAVPEARAVARLGYRQGVFGWDGVHRIAAERLLLLPGGRHGVMLEAGGNTLRPFRLEDGQMVPLAAVAVDHAAEIGASPDGRLVYAFGIEGAVFRFDPSGERLVPLAVLPTGGNHPPRISPDGRFILVNQKYASTFPFFLSDWLEYNPAGGDFRAFDEPGSLQDELIDLAFSPAGDQVYVYKGSIDPRIVVYPRDPRSGEIGEPIQEERGVPRAGGVYFAGQLELDRDGRFLYNLRQDDQKLAVFERNPYDGRLRLLETFATEDGSAAKLGGLAGGGRQRMAVSSTGNEVFLLDEAGGRVGLLRHHCRADDERSLCLGEAGRFRAEMSVFLPQEAERAAGRIEGPAGDSGLFEFFSPDNWESLVKVLDGCGQNGHYWVYAATASDLATRLQVTDTRTGARNSWSQAAGPARQAITDSRALPVCAAGDAPEAGAEEAMEAPNSQELLLGGGRFSVKVHWRTAGGLEGDGQVVPFGSADSGLFSFFHPDNWELLVKVLDGCAINGHYWVYGAASTDLDLRLEVKDLQTTKTRLYLNSLGQPARTITDATAFECGGRL